MHSICDAYPNSISLDCYQFYCVAAAAILHAQPTLYLAAHISGRRKRTVASITERVSHIAISISHHSFSLHLFVIRNSVTFQFFARKHSHIHTRHMTHSHFVVCVLKFACDKFVTANSSPVWCKNDESKKKKKKESNYCCNGSDSIRWFAFPCLSTRTVRTTYYRVCLCAGASAGAVGETLNKLIKSRITQFYAKGSDAEKEYK